MKKDIVVSLCDLTGNAVRPWVEAGYTAVLVDPQHETFSSGGGVVKIPLRLEEAGEYLDKYIGRTAFTFAFPPCTDLAVSGARWFKRKAEANPNFQDEAVAFVHLCRDWCEKLGGAYMIENPVSVLSTRWKKPDHTFHPYEFTGLCREDNYTKKTCLWVGGGFKMPDACRDTTLPPPDSRIHTASPGPERANFRSATPMGFARAVFKANS